MLYEVGPLSIKVAPFNVDAVSVRGATDFVSKPVIGKQPPREYVGEGTGALTMSGSLFPRFIGGMNELALLQAMRRSGKPFFVMRGDGSPLGWYTIDTVQEGHQELAADGVGQKVDVEIQMSQTSKPSRLALFSIIAGLFL